MFMTHLLPNTVLRVCLLLVGMMMSVMAQAQAPDMTLTGLDGKQHALSEYIGQGKWVLVNVWGTRCPPCVEEMPELQAFHEKRKDAMVVGLAIDFPSYGYANKKEVKKFVDDYFIDFPILLGDGYMVTGLGGGMLRGTPTSYMYTPQGKLVAVQLGAVTEKVISNFIDNYKEPEQPSSDQRSETNTASDH